MSPFRREADGRVTARFGDFETELICDLAGQVGDLLEASVGSSDDHLLSLVGIGGGDTPSADPAVARLLPSAYADDDAASAEFRRLTEHSLAERKVANARQVITTLLLAKGAEFDLDAEAQQAWLRTLTDIRLVLAARLGIETDDDATLLRLAEQPDDELSALDVYDWLAAVQTALLDAMEA